MLQKFYEDTIESKFIKALLNNTPLPLIDTVRSGDYILKDNKYISQLGVIKCTQSGYMDGTGTYEILQPFPLSKDFIKYFSNFTSVNNYYDTETHEHLGNYLRYKRDIDGVDLMPFYNCFSYRMSSNLVVDTSEDCGIGKGHDTKVKVFTVPIKFNKTYTVALDSATPYYIKSAFLNEYGLVQTNGGFGNNNITDFLTEGSEIEHYYDTDTVENITLPTTTPPVNVAFHSMNALTDTSQVTYSDVVYTVTLIFTKDGVSTSYVLQQDELKSFFDSDGVEYGSIRFNENGSRILIVGGAGTTRWASEMGTMDAKFEVNATRTTLLSKDNPAISFATYTAPYSDTRKHSNVTLPTSTVGIERVVNTMDLVDTSEVAYDSIVYTATLDFKKGSTTTSYVVHQDELISISVGSNNYGDAKLNEVGKSLVLRGSRDASTWATDMGTLTVTFTVSANKTVKRPLLKVNNSSYLRPYKYCITAKETSGMSEQEKQKVKFLQAHERDLYLVIQLSATNTSAITILEGDYRDKTGRGALERKYDVPALPNLSIDTQDKLLLSQLSLLTINPKTIIAFSNRLVEYLLLNVIDKQDEIADNISRVGQYTEMTEAEESGVYDIFLRERVYSTVANDKETLAIDINGYVDKTAEKVITRGFNV